MPRTFFELNLLANMVAKLGNIVGEHVKFDLSANNVGQFGHTFIPQTHLEPFNPFPRLRFQLGPNSKQAQLELISSL